eukprot:4431137-Pleurochrysis_carterae.AAC.3
MRQRGSRLGQTTNEAKRRLAGEQGTRRNEKTRERIDEREERHRAELMWVAMPVCLRVSTRRRGSWRRESRSCRTPGTPARNKKNTRAPSFV